MVTLEGVTMPYYRCTKCKEEFLVKAFVVQEWESGYTNNNGKRHECDNGFVVEQTNEPEWPIQSGE